MCRLLNGTLDTVFYKFIMKRWVNRKMAYLIGQLSDIRDAPSVMSESNFAKEKQRINNRNILAIFHKCPNN